jgi:hypothetical protein
MAYTLAQLQQAVQDYCQNSETTFVANISNFIRNTEDLILQSVDLELFRKNVTGNMTSSNKYLAKPTDYLSSFSLSITVSGEKQFLLMKDVNFLQEYAPGSGTGVPKYYAPFDISNFIIAPTPDSGYAVELHYFYRPASLADAGSSGTTWLSTNAPMAMLYGCLVEAYGFMKGEADVMAHYKEMFGIALSRLKDLAEAKENTDAYRMGLPTRARS